MHNMYTSTSIISFRTKATQSYSFNDYSYIFNGRCPSCCCTCYPSFPIHYANRRLSSIKPSLIYGLRQSTLIQWAPSRRLILRGEGDRCCCRLPIRYVGRSCFGESCSIIEKGDAKIGGKKSTVRCSVRVFGEKFEMGQAKDVWDAEAMLSLLTEDVSEKCLNIRERKGREVKKGKVVKRENGVIERGKVRKDNIASGYMESDLKRRLESVNFQSKEEFCRRREEREDFLKGEEQRLRRGGSSSSYYSLSESGDFESDKEVEANCKEILGESFNDSRKRSGVVISEEVEGESQEYDDGRRKCLVAERHDGTKVGSSAEWDWRKKSEKKLTEETVHESTSGNDSVSSHSQLLQVHERSSAKASTSKAQSSYEEQQSMSDVNLHKESRSHSIQKENQVSRQSGSSVEYNKSMETSHNETSGNDATIRSCSGRILEGTEENAIFSGYCKTCGQVTGEDNLRRHSQQHVELSEIREANRIRTSTVDRQFESRIKQQEEKSSSLESLVKQENEQYLHDTYVATGQANTRRHSQLYGEVAYAGGSCSQNASNSQVRLETRMKHLEENSSLLMSCLDAGHQYQSGTTVIRQNESRSKDIIGASGVQSREMETITTSQSSSSSEQRLHYEDSYLTLKVKSVEQLMEKQEQIDEQTGVRNQLQTPIKRGSFHKSLSGDTTHVSSFVGLSSQTQVQQIGNEGDKSISQFLMMPPSSQLVERDPTYVGPVDRFARQDSSRTSEAGSSSLYADVLSGTPSSHDEVSGYRRSEHEDALVSAERMETSSIRILGEFVENMRHETSTSGIQNEKFPETDSAHESKKHAPGELTQADSGRTHLKKQDSRRSSGGSGTKGPSDEMWDVRDPSVQETRGMEASEATATSGNAVVRRSGRSFWNVVGDVFLFRWGKHAETHKSTIKSGGQGSPNESAGCEAWFSGHEPEEAGNCSNKRDKTSTMQATAGQLILRGTASQSQEGVGLVSSMDKMKHIDVALSSSIIGNKSGSGGISGEATVDWNVDQQSSQATSSVALQLPPARQTGNLGIEEISEVARTEAYGGAGGEQTEHRIDLSLGQVSDSDGELRRRKLQRTNQVVKERFEKWEEAYKHESEQRKIDEMFMGEALLEAKKAADVWEVPVGAVLVQNGKIIARGYNLVEEVRDSTAHAEMICIREASNTLRTWRLSDTTLYVTLEPCPMCAGAILQARIDKLVWGAPNKLLGADGSWIRLFPNGSKQESGLEPTDKPAAPVHPFHPKMTIRRGILEAECANTMQQFFQLRRKKQKKIEPPAPPSYLPVPHHPSKIFHKMHDAFHLMFCV